MQRIESCHSIWLFDSELGRFRRAPRGSNLDAPAPDTEWELYFGLEVDATTGAFAVVLNEGGTRLLRSWQHNEPCQHCGADATAELTITSISGGSSGDEPSG